ncbi:MAG: hypothetical protein GY801_01615, partial [bacterium]|nr:hypothetical protein [bacterium]
MKEFSKWTLEEVEESFQLTPVKHNQALNHWETAELDVTPQENAELLALCERLREYVHDWNEEELKIHFIGGLVNLVGYLHKEYQAFFERRLSVNINNERLSGTVDCIIAAGRRSPKQPYFCLHEYKPQRHKAPDPWGQVLIAMVAAQKLKQNDRPVYGAYVMGRNWYFVVLHGMTHVGSLAYDATKEDDLRQIFKMLNEIHQTDDRA